MFVNFAIIFVVIGAAMKSKLPGYFRSRNEAIQRGIVEARAASEDAKRRLADIEARLSKLDIEVAQIKSSAERESAAEEARIRSAAEADAKRILAAAEQEIEAAGRQARRDLKALAADLAVDLAARKIQIDSATDESLVRNFVAQLGKDGR
jgi:F-type H+-transporting ATPase subunit b